MTDNKWCYCKHSTTNFDDNCATWCDKHNAKIFNGDATLCDGCKLFEQDDLVLTFSLWRAWRSFLYPADEEGVVTLEQTIKDMTKERDYLDARLADFENMARDFVEYRAPDYICRVYFEMMLKESEE